MKKIFSALLLLAVTAVNLATYAQCDKNLVLKSSKTEFLDASDTVQKSIDENTTITITPKSITISPGDDHAMTGMIQSVTCAWKTAFVEGRSEFKTVFDDHGELKYMTIILEGKKGKISFLVIFDDDSGKRIRVWADSFVEQK